VKNQLICDRQLVFNYYKCTISLDEQAKPIVKRIFEISELDYWHLIKENLLAGKILHEHGEWYLLQNPISTVLFGLRSTCKEELRG
jgi:hypothetical protein